MRCGGKEGGESSIDVLFFKLSGLGLGCGYRWIRVDVESPGECIFLERKEDMGWRAYLEVDC